MSGLPPTRTSLTLLPLVVAWTRVLPLALGLASCIGISMVRMLFLMVAFMFPLVAGYFALRVAGGNGLCFLHVEKPVIRPLKSQHAQGRALFPNAKELRRTNCELRMQVGKGERRSYAIKQTRPETVRAVIAETADLQPARAS